MPNTLVHLGIQGAISQGVSRSIDVRWAFVGAVIPDVPWMLQRMMGLTAIDPLDLRLYCVAQASWGFSLMLAGACAVLSRRSVRVMAVLCLGTLLHLLLDAVEIKWGNGVHLLAPLSWAMTSFDLLWPENTVVYVFTALGLGYVGFVFRSTLSRPLDLEIGSPMRFAAAAVLLALYLLLPFTFLGVVEDANAHYVKTLRAADTRAGKSIEFDREAFTPTAAGARLYALGATWRLEGVDLQEPAILSVRGTFRTNSVIEVHDYHVHDRSIRELTTIMGLALVLLMVSRGIWAGIRTAKLPRSPE